MLANVYDNQQSQLDVSLLYFFFNGRNIVVVIKGENDDECLCVLSFEF